MTEFTASNGIYIRWSDRNELEFKHPMVSDRWREVSQFARTSNLASAIREFFQQEEDERLGRWRWPESPSYIVYPGRAGWLHVLREQFGTSEVFRIEDVCASVWKPMSAAKAYLDAHPEPKPWHDAKPGEVWELTFSEDGGGGTDAWTVSRAGLFEHPNFVSRVSPKDRTIMSGTCVWQPGEAAE